MPSFESDTDRLNLLTELGDPVTYTPSGGSPATIYGTVDDEETVEPMGDAAVIGSIPAIKCRTSDLTGTVKGGTILHDGTTYNITEVLPDRTGMTDLSLEVA